MGGKYGYLHYGLAANKERNKILVGRRQTLGEVLAETAQEPPIRFVQGRDRSQHYRVDEKRRGDGNYQSAKPRADEPSCEGGSQSCKQDATQNMEGLMSKTLRTESMGTLFL